MVPRNTAAWACNATSEKATRKKTTFWRLYSSAWGLSKSICYSLPSEHKRNAVHWKLVNSFLWGSWDFLGTVPPPHPRRSTKAPREKAVLSNKDSLANILIPVYFVKLALTRHIQCHYKEDLNPIKRETFSFAFISKCLRDVAIKGRCS